MRDLASRLTQRVQLTTDGLKSYLGAVETAFGADIDYAMLHKIYGSPEGHGNDAATAPPSALASTSVLSWETRT